MTEQDVPAVEDHGLTSTPVEDQKAADVSDNATPPNAPPNGGKACELPDAIRVPLDELEADAAYIIGRVAADGSCGAVMVEAIRRRTRAIRDALTAGVEVFQQAELDAAKERGEQIARDLAKAVERGNVDESLRVSGAAGPLGDPEVVDGVAPSDGGQR